MKTKKINHRLLTGLLILTGILLIGALAGIFYYRHTHPTHNFAKEYKSIIDSYIPGGWKTEAITSQYDSDDTKNYEVISICYETDRNIEYKWIINTVNMWYGDKGLTADEVFAQSVSNHMLRRVEALLRETQSEIESAENVFDVYGISYSCDNTLDEWLHNTMNINMTSFTYDELSKLSNIQVSFRLKKKEGATDDAYNMFVEKYMSTLEQKSAVIEFILAE